MLCVQNLISFYLSKLLTLLLTAELFSFLLNFVHKLLKIIIYKSSYADTVETGMINYSRVISIYILYVGSLFTCKERAYV